MPHYFYISEIMKWEAEPTIFPLGFYTSEGTYMSVCPALAKSCQLNNFKNYKALRHHNWCLSWP